MKKYNDDDGHNADGSCNEEDIEMLLSVFSTQGLGREHARQAIIDTRGDVEQALEDLLLYYQAYETALELSHADANVCLPHEKPPRRDGAVSVSQAPPPLKQQQQQKKTQEELDMELAMKLQAEFDQEEAQLRKSGGGSGGGMRLQRQSANASPRAPGFGLDFTFLTDEQRAVLVNAVKQAIVPLMEGVLGNIAIPPFNQAIENPSFGRINFGTTTPLQVEKVDIPMDIMDITFQKDLSIKTKPFGWTYDKRGKFPELKDDGTAKVKASQINIHIVIVNDNGITDVIESDVVIGDLKIKTSDTKAKFIYNIVLKIMSSFITKMLQDAIKEMVHNVVKENTDVFSIKF